jgi:hypothetical protein
MEFPRDEVRRQLREAQRDHDAALPSWRDALRRVFDPDGTVTPATKRALLGVPDRRRFLTIGGMTVAASAVLAACGGSEEEQLPVTGTLPPRAEAGATTTTTPEQGQESDVTLLRTAQSIEVLAVDVYQQALDSGLVTTPAVADAAALFQQHHRDHAEAVAQATTAAGGQPYDEPNAYLLETVITPALAVLDTQEAVVSLAYDLENLATQTYVYAAELLTTPLLRQAAMSIGAVEARHVSVLLAVQDQPPVPFAFMPRRDRIDERGLVPQETPLTPTTRVTTTTTEPEATSGTTIPGGTTGTTTPGRTTGTTVAR